MPVRSKKYSLQARATAKAGQWLNSIPRPLLRLLPTVENSSGDRLDPQIALSLKVLGWLEKLGGGGFTELPLDKGRALIDDEALMGGGRPEKGRFGPGVPRRRGTGAGIPSGGGVDRCEAPHTDLSARRRLGLRITGFSRRDGPLPVQPGRCSRAFGGLSIGSRKPVSSGTG